tara:strand:+ start:187 stop:702 length:516 start_codon:yes stop_codon:yes gene_type:complete
MIVKNLCPPALIFLIFSLVQIVVDSLKGLYNTAFIKVWIMILFTALLNILCIRGLSVISWIIVFLPFIFQALLTAILLVNFGLNPSTGITQKTVTSDDSYPTTNSTATTTTNASSNWLPEMQSDADIESKQYIINDEGLHHTHAHQHSDGSIHTQFHTHTNWDSSTHDHTN